MSWPIQHSARRNIRSWAGLDDAEIDGAESALPASAPRGPVILHKRSVACGTPSLDKGVVQSGRRDKMRRDRGCEPAVGLGCQPHMDIGLIAVQVGDALKYSTTVNEVDRIGAAVLKVRRETFLNDAITSVRAQGVHDWVHSLAKGQLTREEMEGRLIKFCRELAGEDGWPGISKVLQNCGISASKLNREEYNRFMGRGFHAEVIKHAKALYMNGDLFHAVFEAAKAYNKAVRVKAQSTKDGQSLMLEVWGWDKGCLKITACQTDTDKNVQDGVKFLSAGLMSAIRNPTAHEPAVDWPISLSDCLDILSFISFLYRQLDRAVYFKT